MIVVAISEFKVKCLALLEQVRRTRQPIRVTRHGNPVADILPPAPVVDRAAWIQSVKGSFTIKGDIVSPANDDNEWELSRH